MTLKEFEFQMDCTIPEDYIISLRCREKAYEPWDYINTIYSHWNDHWIWGSDWYKGQEYVEILGYIPVRDTNVQRLMKAAGVQSHSEKEIYLGCKRLMQHMVKIFEEYLFTIGVDIDTLNEEERFSYAISNFEIVQDLFLFGTTHSGGNSTREKCRELGLDYSENVEFSFEEHEYDD